MALGYEGWVKIGSTFALGTGTSVPNLRTRIDSQSAYGGEIKTPASEIAIGYPRDYDWSMQDGTITYEMSRDMFNDEIKPWLFDRQAVKSILFASRAGNLQQYGNCIWTSLAVSASEGGAVDGQMGFAVYQRDAYTFGDDWIDNKKGEGLLCPRADFPKPLNEDANRNPVPYWNTTVRCKTASGGSYVLIRFTDWSADFSQDATPFFACEANSTPVEPKYIAVGVMTATFSGSYMMAEPLADELYAVELNVGGVLLTMYKLELQSINDDVVGGDALTPIAVEYNVYKLAA